MAQRLNKALEMMGWRSVDESGDFAEADYSDTVDTHEYPFSNVEKSQPVEMNRPAYIPLAETPAEVDRRRIVTIHPRNFSDALAVGESFRDGIPVIMNLTDMDAAEARRIIDFAGGLAFGLHGVVERVTTRVFLLSPEGTEVAHDRVGGRSSLYQ